MNTQNIDEEIQILYKDEHLVAVYKPAGFHVHQHEDVQFPVPRSQICLYQVRDMIQQYIYPVHRLDAPTSGILIFALSSEAAREISIQFSKQQVKKTYELVVRGWVPESGEINIPLELDSTNELAAATTRYQKIAQTEIHQPVGKRFSSARYSYVRAFPLTGKYHQIRRHFQRLNHPLVGDTRHGDSHHNRFFREKIGIQGLCLRSTQLELQTSWMSAPLKFDIENTETLKTNQKWNQIKKLFFQDKITQPEALQAFPLARGSLNLESHQPIFR